MAGSALRVAFDALLLGRHDTGVERYSRQLLGAFEQSGHAGVALTVFHRDGLFEGDGRGFESRPVRGLARARWRRIVWQQVFFPSRLARGFDLLHAPAYVAPLRALLPVVLTVHDLIALDHPELCRRANVLHYRALVPASVRRAACLIVPSAFVRRRVLERFGLPPGRVNVVHEGVSDVFRATPDERTLRDLRTRWSLEGRFLLFVGNLEPKKNLVRLLDAFTRLKPSYRDLRLVLCGRPGWGLRALERALRASACRGDIVLTGYLPDSDVCALYHLAELFVFPSLVEGFGLPALEAMACGTPVITADRAALAELAGPAAVSVDPQDPRALERALREVLDSRDRRAELRERGLAHSRRFTWPAAAEQTLDVYRSALGRA